MCVEALCQAVPCDRRDCKEPLISFTWYDLRVALPDLDQAWQRALHGLKEWNTHTRVKDFSTDEVAVEAELSNREQSFAYHAADLFGFFGTVDANEVAVPYVDSVTAITPQPPTEVQFQPLKENLQGFYTIVPTSNHFPKDGHRRNSKKAHFFLPKSQPLPSSHTAGPSLSRTSPSRCWQPTSLAQHGASGASRNGRVRTALQSSKLCIDHP